MSFGSSCSLVCPFRSSFTVLIFPSLFPTSFLAGGETKLGVHENKGFVSHSRGHRWLLWDHYVLVRPGPPHLGNFFPAHSPASHLGFLCFVESM